jgi:hypothetical protein
MHEARGLMRDPQVKFQQSRHEKRAIDPKVCEWLRTQASHEHGASIRDQS